MITPGRYIKSKVKPYKFIYIFYNSTKAFHKEVLNDFVDVMNEKAFKMIEILEEKVKKQSGVVDMYWHITLCALGSG